MLSASALSHPLSYHLEFRRVKGIAIDGNVPRGEAAAINFSEFYDSSRQRYARFTAEEEEESFARPLARSHARGEEDGGI